MQYGDTYCGIYCGACSVLRHGETGRADGFVACLRGVPPQELTCGGCKSDQLYAGCRTCSLRDCAVKKGLAHCSECREYPCKSYRGWQSAATLLPHVRESVASLEAVRRDGAGAWLAAQERRWSCPGCGARFSWYAERCAECGRDLAGLGYAMSGLRGLICRWVLPLVYRRGKARSG
jgi:hypothetical protein